MVAKAQPVNGLYVGAGAGVNFITDPYIRKSPGLGNGTRPLSGKNQSFDPGFQGEASVGYGLGNGLRFEIEGNYLDNNLHNTTGHGLSDPLGRHAGKTTVCSATPCSTSMSACPGCSRMSASAPATSRPTGTTFKSYGFNGSAAGGTNVNVVGNGYKDNFAYQAIIGAAYPIPMIPGLSLTAEYRFIGLLDNANFHGVLTTTNAEDRRRHDQPWQPGQHQRLQPQHHVRCAVCLRCCAAAAGRPRRPRCRRRFAAGPHLPGVLRLGSSANLTDRARQIVAEAAQASTHVSYTRIEVNGYTDLSGTAQYNQGLSVRRANTVAAELVRDGVPRTAINIQGFGESHPLVPTAKGVREPQNRRVEIIIR